MIIWLPMRSLAPLPFLSLPALLYETAVRIRNHLYDRGALRTHRLPSPVISIGNITMGGTGKTPMAVHVARTLVKDGVQVAILTRGYGRTHPHKTIILPPNCAEVPDARILGDEPAVLRRNLPFAWMGISKNRFRAGQTIAERSGPTVFVLDDGFQHRRLHRDLNILIIDAHQPLARNHVIPRGTLREPLCALRRAHIVMLNGNPEESSEKPLIEALRRFAPEASLFRCVQQIESMVRLDSWKKGPPYSDSCMVRSAYLVAAVGNPSRFLRDVLGFGTKVVGHRFFRDHHWPSIQEWTRCVREARNLNAEAIVTTEKDAVKIAGSLDFPILVAIQSTEIHNPVLFGERLKECIGPCLRGRHGDGVHTPAPA